MSIAKLSISKVAEAAGVSAATVSRVINGLPGVNVTTAAQVHSTIKHLGYVRQRARTVRGTIQSRPSQIKVGSIAVITLGQSKGWLELPVAAAVFMGIQRGASAHGLRLVVDEMPVIDRPPRILTDREVDGVIAIVASGIPIDEYCEAFARVQKHVPVVWAMNSGCVTAHVDHIAPDHIGIGQLAYDYLKKSGCKRVGFLTRDPAWALIRTRGQSFLNSALDDRIPATAYLVATDANEYTSAAYGRRIVTASSLPGLAVAFAADKERPDGLFIVNDITTAAFYSPLIAAGVQPETDVRIISCDAEEARLASLHPRPASIDIGANEIGYRSVSRLINRIQHPGGIPIVVNVAPQLARPPASSLSIGDNH